VGSQGLKYLLFDCLEYAHLHSGLRWKIPVVLKLFHLGSGFSWAFDSLAFHHMLNYEHIPNIGLFHLWRSVKFFYTLFIIGKNCHGSRSIKTALFSYTRTQHTAWRNEEWIKTALFSYTRTQHAAWRNEEWTLWWEALFKWYPKMTEIQWHGELTRWEKLVIFLHIFVGMFISH